MKKTIHSSYLKAGLFTVQTHEIRERFTAHFVKAGHQAVPSASLILDDPNLLFVNAGMVPFKPYFLGQQTPPFPNGTATSIQKCVRTLDIEEVGITTRHNTFFQMAGNFSFGQYFKEGAITHAWELLTGAREDGGFGLDAERLWVTVYLDDDEAQNIWHEKIGLPTERIQRLGMADNYWSMGIPGPCGPCSEIYYDRGPEYGKEGGPIADDTRYMEIWNLVFMQNERGQGTGKDNFEILGPLPKKNIDTGLGVERVACILQGVDNVYETDLLRPVIDVAEQLSGHSYGADHLSDIRFRVIADHSRTGMMLILDGVTPGNEGRGYILRRLLRRIIRSARLLGATKPTMEAFMKTIMDTMTPSYPEIAQSRDRILSIAVNEEKAFLRTLESGTRLFEQAADQVKKEGGTVLGGEEAFTLHDTYGFPIDLTLEMAAEAGLTVDREGFDSCMAEQKARAQADSRAKKHGHLDLTIYRDFVDNHPTVFTGYDKAEDDATVIGLVADGKIIDKACEGDKLEVILDTTPFYAEGGGQTGDRGEITGDDGLLLLVTDTQKIGRKLWLHKVEVKKGEIATGQTVHPIVDTNWRHGARQAHSATHLLHAAVRKVLGPTAVQSGSLNKPGYLRLDFSYTEQLTKEQIREIEALTNWAVDINWDVFQLYMSLQEAKDYGALALFGETYSDTVRVIEMGGAFSRELCGGTHVDHTSEVGPVAIINETSVGSGIRRLEAYVGLPAFHHLASRRNVAEALAFDFKAPAEKVQDRVEALKEKLKAAEKQLADLHANALAEKTGKLVDQAEELNGLRFVHATLPQGTTGGDLRTIATDLKNRLGDKAGVVVLGADDGTGKAPYVVACTAAAVKQGFKAGDLVKMMNTHVDGRGGGKPDMAQGSGTNKDGFTAGFDAIKQAIG